ncbi:MAG TPA: argininosuccinate lyase, partial [Ferruginibacter sp.]|nr:argininosuccinate lyase [Ferruginibacter sp.]
QMMQLMLEHVEVKKDLLSDEKYASLFSVEEVNKLVLTGMPFRDAYKKVGAAVEAGEFTHAGSPLHTHEGSIGNLCNAEIRSMMDNIILKFDFNKVKIALQQLLS